MGLGTMDGAKTSSVNQVHKTFPKCPKCKIKAIALVEESCRFCGTSYSIHDDDWKNSLMDDLGRIGMFPEEKRIKKGRGKGQRFRRLRGRLIARFGTNCMWCGKETYLTADPDSDLFCTVEHVTRKVDGGLTDEKNCRIACRKCNTSRGNLKPSATSSKQSDS